MVPLAPPTWLLALLVTLCAFFLPMSPARDYLVYSSVMTLLVLPLIDLLVAAHGGDTHLLRCRVCDTLVGAGWALFGLLLMRVWRWASVRRVAA